MIKNIHREMDVFYRLLMKPSKDGKYNMNIDSIAEIQKITLLVLPDCFSSMPLYPRNNAAVVMMINTILYRDKPFRKVRLEAPKPRDANIIPPLQHIVAAAAVKTEVMLKSLFFIMSLLRNNFIAKS